MAGKVADSIEGTGEKAAKPVQRLCNEIQLFDLCDLEKCGHKKGLFCTSRELLDSFEAIAEEDERPAATVFISDGLDDEEATDDGYDDSLDDDQFGGEGDEGYEEEE